MNFNYYPQFFTATILEWKHLLKDDALKNIIIESLLFLKKEGSIKIYAFVIMTNHIHLIWQIRNGYKQNKIQFRFLKFTAQQIKFKMIDAKDDRLDQFLVMAKDRRYQIWERNPLSVDLWSEFAFIQKLNYIHNNPLKYFMDIPFRPEDYKYSSAKFYETGIDEFNLLTHYLD